MKEILLTIVDHLKNLRTLEILGVITGVLCVYFAAKNKIWNWPIALISVTIYMVIFFKAKLYADMGLQIYFFITSCYGWYFWSHKSKKEAKTKVDRCTKKEIWLSIVAMTLFTGLVGVFLKYKTDAFSPFIDSFCTAGSIVAQIFLARKILENWLIWILVDIVYVALYISKGFYFTTAMYIFFIYIAVVGYLEWRKLYRSQHVR